MSFGRSGPPGPVAYGDFAKTVAFPVIKEMFRAVLLFLGPKTPQGNAATDARTWTFGRSDLRLLHSVRVQCFQVKSEIPHMTCSLGGLSKIAYWLSQWSLHTELQSQLLPQILSQMGQRQRSDIVITPHITHASLAVGCEFLWRRYLFGLSVLDNDIRHSTWMLPAGGDPRCKLTYNEKHIASIFKRITDLHDGRVCHLAAVA